MKKQSLTEPVVLHVGMPKTGTTALQWALRAAEPQLDAQGWWYPHLARFAAASTPVSHWDVITAAEDPGESRLGHEGFEAFLHELRTRRATHRTVLSAEHAWLPTTTGMSRHERLVRLKDLLGGEVAVVAYLRRQSDYAVSFFNQCVRSRRLPGDTLEEMFVQFLPTIDHLDYRAMVEELENVFGREQVHVRVADRRELVDGDTIADFCDLLGLERAEPVELPFADNAAASLAVLEAKAIVDRLPGITQDQANRMMLDIHRAVPERWGSSDHQLVRRWADLEALDAEHDEGNRWVAQTHLGREELFPPAPARSLPDRPAAPPGSEAAELLAAGLLRLSEADHQRRLARQAARRAGAAEEAS